MQIVRINPVAYSGPFFDGEFRMVVTTELATLELHFQTF